MTGRGWPRLTRLTMIRTWLARNTSSQPVVLAQDLQEPITQEVRTRSHMSLENKLICSPQISAKITTIPPSQAKQQPKVPEYSVKRVRFGNVRNITLYIDDNYGAEERVSRLWYLGFKGESTDSNDKSGSTVEEVRDHPCSRLMLIDRGGRKLLRQNMSMNRRNRRTSLSLPCTRYVIQSSPILDHPCSGLYLLVGGGGRGGTRIDGVGRRIEVPKAQESSFGSAAAECRSPRAADRHSARATDRRCPRAAHRHCPRLSPRVDSRESVGAESECSCTGLYWSSSLGFRITCFTPTEPIVPANTNSHTTSTAPLLG
jgi:hypothetical protein